LRGGARVYHRVGPSWRRGRTRRARSQVRERLKRTAEDVVATGIDLLRAKELLVHGSFGTWLENEFSLSHRSATQFMRAAERFGHRLEVVADLPSGVLLELASPGVPDDLVDEVLSGRTPATVGAVRDAVRGRRRSSSYARVARDFIQALWDLPDDPGEAAEVITAEVVHEVESDPESNFAAWAADVFARSAALLDAITGGESH
jgi:hypothetical protein